VNDDLFLFSGQLIMLHLFTPTKLLSSFSAGATRLQLASEWLQATSDV
jgi:hypothetical protein